MKKKKTNIKTENEKQEESKAGTVFVIFLIVVLIVAFLRIYRVQWIADFNNVSFIHNIFLIHKMLFF